MELLRGLSLCFWWGESQRGVFFRVDDPSLLCSPPRPSPNQPRSAPHEATPPNTTLGHWIEGDETETETETETIQIPYRYRYNTIHYTTIHYNTLQYRPDQALSPNSVTTAAMASEEQAQEIEVLQSIYPDEFLCMSTAPSPQQSSPH